MSANKPAPDMRDPRELGTDKSICELCGHSLVDNVHGFDQNDADMDGDELVHSGRCTYCKICREGLVNDNPFEPSETPAQQDRRIGKMIRDNVDRRLKDSK